MEKGPHGGRLLKKGNITAEITIFEKGTPPHFRIYALKDNQPLAPSQFRLSINLKRLNGDVQTIHFKPVNEFQQSEEVIEEPHSFDVAVTLSLLNHQYQWAYASYEGRITLPPEVANAAGIKVLQAKPVHLQKKLEVVGIITPNRETLAPIYARYPGLIKDLNKKLGDVVEKGERLATVESNESLQEYPIHSPINGTIVRKRETVGEMAKEDSPIYVVADLSTVWADLTLYRKDAKLVKKGMPVKIMSDEGSAMAESTVSYISPLGIEDSQTILARAILSNTDHLWLPGIYINAIITIAEKEAPVAVRTSAIQRLRDWDVVFIKQGNTYEAAPVTLGENDGEWVEILSGLKAGQTYVAENSFFLKADLGKSEASHDH